MYKIKQSMEDFLVKEASNVKIRDNGRYTYFLLKKKGYNTLDAVNKVAFKLGVNMKDLGFAGNKDKAAITEQMVSAKGLKKEFEDFNVHNIEVKLIGYGGNPISLGDLKGNEFIITVRDLNEKEFNNFYEKTKKKPALMMNYFGDQRFSKVNVDVGRAIVKGDFKKAAEILNLDVKNGDFIGRLRRINKKILSLYVHAYQSYIWNGTARMSSGKGLRFKKIPIVGFGTELGGYSKDLNEIIVGELNKEKISLRNFIIPKMPELSVEGGERDTIAEIENLEVVDKGKDWLKIKFFLKKGSYATEAIKFMFS